MYHRSLLNKKLNPYLLNDPIYIYMYVCMYVYIIDLSSVKNFPLIYGMTFMYIIGLSSVKNIPLIY